MTSKKALRTFVAVDLTDELKQALASTIQQLKKSSADVKWVAARNCHVTLKFLGDTNPEQVETIKNSLKLIAEKHQSFELSLDGLGAFPSMNAPRIIWVGIKNGAEALTELANDVEDSFSNLGFAKENRPFASHITIGRSKSNKNIQELKRLLKEVSVEEGKTQEVKSVTLFQSTLTSEGPIYQPLETYPLAHR